MLMDTNGERKTNETVLIFFTENIESAGCVYFNILNQRLKREIFVPCSRGKNPDLPSKYQKHHHFKV